MSKEITPQSNNNEEVDLGQLFKLIGQGFDKLFKFIGSILKSVYSVFIYASKAVLVNYKIILAVMILAGVIGYSLEKIRPNVYFSQVLVKPYFDSKFQLVTNINYYNALIAERDYNQLQSIFEIDENSAKSLISFNISPGPETENDKIVQYERFIRQVDSVRAQDISYDDFIEKRSIYSGNLFEVNVESFDKNIFRSLENGLNSTFTNTYSVKRMEKRDSILAIERARIMRSLKNVDSLKGVYIKVMQDEISSGGGLFSLKEGMSIVQERVNTKEYELLTKEIELQQALAALDSQKVEEDVFFDIISSFQDVGSISSSIWKKYSIIFPFVSFVMLVLIFLSAKFINHVLKYEA